MKTTTSTIVLGLALAASCFAGAAQAAPATPAGYYGDIVRAEAADRKIVVAPGATGVNVTNGETVTFIVGDKSFTFHFQTYSQTQSLELAAIAPADINVAGVRVYVAASPLYQN